VLVKDAENQMWWVHEKLGEIADTPPNLNELIEHFQNVKKKNQLMATRSEEDKEKARRKILGRNLADEPEVGSLPPADKKKTMAEPPRLKDEYHSPAKKAQKQNALNKAISSPNPSKLKGGNMMVMDEVFEQTTDPKIKRGTMEQSIHDLDIDLHDLDANMLDDDPYKYTKSTLKKGHDDQNSPYLHSKRKKDLLAGERAVIADLPEPPMSAEFSLEQHRNDMPILEMDLDLGTDDDLGEKINGDFITPSGKKNASGLASNAKGLQRSKAQANMRKEEANDGKYQMIDSAMLEKMISDINQMQMKVSMIEQENAGLKRTNVDIITNQKKLRDVTKNAIETTKTQLNEKIMKRENRLEDLVREEIKKSELGTLDQSKANLNILKDIQDMKLLLEQSVLRNNPAANIETKNEFQPTLPMVDSHVFGQIGVHPTNQNIQHSFGADFSRPPIQPPQVPPLLQASQLYNMPIPLPFNHSSALNRQSSLVVDPLAASRGLGAPAFKGERDSLSSGGHIGSSQGGAAKWLNIILNEKSKLATLKDKLKGLKLAVQAKAIEVANFEQDMNVELQRLGLPQNHSLVTKLRSNIKHQAKDYRYLVKQHESEKGKYTLKKSGIAMLERTLLFVQNAGGINKEADKHLEEVYSSFKNLAHFGKDEENRDMSFNSSESRSQSIDISHSDTKGTPHEVPLQPESATEGIAPQLNMVKKDEPAQEQAVKHDQEANLTSTQASPDQIMQPHELGGTFTETIELKPALDRQSKSASKTGYYAKGSYFNELNRVTSYLAKGSSSYSMEPDYSKLRDSLAYQPLSRTVHQEPASDNMKRYFQTQAKWYADMRGEVVSP
jgi:hypothetical protein